MSITSGFQISKSDMLRGKEVKPGVYLLTIKSLDQKPSKSDQSSMVIHVHMVFEGGEYNEVPITHYISEKAPGMAVPFLEAVFGQKFPEDGVLITPEMLNKLPGRKVKAAIKMEKTESFGMQKRIEGFMPA